jgi:VanZ family protein
MVGMNDFLRRWSFALVMMIVIFAFSSIPSNVMPNFSWADVLVKKSGHVVVYSLLALSFWYGFGWKREHLWQAWLLAFLYAILDEFHQSFVPGRNAWWADVAIDSAAAALALGVAAWWRGKKNKSG